MTTIKQLKQDLDQLQYQGKAIPHAYYEFEEETELPYIAYETESTDAYHADDAIYVELENMRLELYTYKRQPEVENLVDSLLKNRGIIYTASYNYFPEHKMQQKVYSFQIDKL